MTNKIDILKKSELFSVVGERDLSEFEKAMECRRVQEGECLASCGDTATFFFVLKNGTVMVALKNGKAVVLNQPADFIGLELLSAKGIYTSTLTALTDCEILVIPRETFLAFIQSDAPAAATFMQAWESQLSRQFPFITQEIPITDYQY